MATISKTSVTYKPLYIQEKPDILIKMDTALNFPCKICWRTWYFCVSL